jgi:hypothetical protein
VSERDRDAAIVAEAYRRTVGALLVVRRDAKERAAGIRERRLAARGQVELFEGEQ